MKTFLFTVSRSRCHRTCQFTKMASSSKKFSTETNEDKKEITLRAYRKKRGREHYKKKHGVDIPEAREPGRGNEKVYYLDKGLRKVYPYYFNFGTYVKGRWLGKTIYEVFSNDFSRTGNNHKELIENGKITVNGKKVPLDFVLGSNMFLEHRTHRHEMPVLDEPIEIIEDTEDILVINKPASLPVHPCGRYRENSVTQILNLQYGYSHLRILYRLDRLTSGLLIMPKTTKTSRKLESQLGRRLLHKQYVCRVDGKFPDGEIECNAPLGCISIKLSIYGVDQENGKASTTTFTRLSYNGRTSVVKCIPHTGRTHQIRIHLQYLGYPICNDPIYNSMAFGPNKAKDGVVETTCEQIETEILNTSNNGRWVKGPNPRYHAKFGKSEVKSVEDLDIKDEQQSNKTNTDIENLPDAQHTHGIHGENAEVTKIDISDDRVEKLCVDVTEKVIDDSSAVAESCTKTGLDETSVVTESDIPCKRLKLSDACEEISDASQKKDCAKEITELSVEVAKDYMDTSNGSESVAETSEGMSEVKGEMKADCNAHRDVNTVSSKESGEGNELIDEKVEIKDNESERVESNEVEIGKVKSNEDSMDTDVKVVKKSFILRDVAKINTDPEYDESRDTLDEFCEDCKNLYHDPERTALMIYLHAVSYKGPDWEYSTTLPYWASDDFDERTDTNTTNSPKNSE